MSDEKTEAISEFENPELIPLSRLALRIQLAATGIATSLLLLFIPNVETITFFCFFFGFVFSYRYAVSTTITMVLGWEILISMILSFSGITFFFKIAAWLIITSLGYISRRLHVTSAFEFAILGMISALIYDLIVTLSIPLFFVTTQEAFIPLFLTYFVFGLPFTIIHIISNSLLFALFPRLVSSVTPLFELKFPNFTKVASDYFESGKHYVVPSILVIIIVVSLIVGAYVNTPTNTVSSEITIHLDIHYAGVLPNESHLISTYLNETFLEISQLVANITVTYKYLGAPYVEAINNVWEYLNVTTNSWIIYLNSQQIPVGVGKSLSVLHIESNDTILWNYEKSI